MTKNIKILMKKPGEQATVVEPANDLAALQHLVGGYIETVTIAKDMVVICNEEGRMLGLPYNTKISNVEFVGTILLAGVRRDSFADLPVDVSAIKRLLPQLWEV